MSEITDEMVEIAARAAMNTARARGGLPPLGNIDEGFQDADLWRAEARAALSAVAPLIAAQEREACAMVAGDGARRFSHLSDKYRALMGVAFAIRGRAESKEG